MKENEKPAPKESSSGGDAAKKGFTNEGTFPLKGGFFTKKPKDGQA
jgi:hypothetical protein